ncbi:MAG: enoyl-CoA hydratase/isomerase family protein [Dermatophilaceae bacterium]
MTDFPHPHIRVDSDGPVLRITLCNPDHRNTQTPTFWTALGGISTRIDSSVRVVVLSAEGPAFSAGLDRRILVPGGMPGEPDVMAVAAASAQGMAEVTAPYQRAFAVWREVPPIVVAAVQGYAIGAGFQLALAADLRVVADNVKFAMRETSLGMVPDLAGSGTLVHLVGYSRALEICATGRYVEADEAVRLGLANLAVPAAHLPSATEDLVAALLAAPNASLFALKPLLRQAISAAPEEQMRNERDSQGKLIHVMANLFGASAGRLMGE